MGSTNIYTYSDHHIPNHNHAFHWQHPGLYENSGSEILKRVGITYQEWE